ncbi:aldo/keto reductase [Modestobacter muralis]|uniref:Aldo/keto reductase n=1 Tax=Modestobacter muralis TaxID=1608614 RepID=A0A6P0EPX1_9ACTN|nr:aldo/keto reductase [Modestobacter muralis]NEN49590.1 aldo/keto reductase [Modestobacter muralis]
MITDDRTDRSWAPAADRYTTTEYRRAGRSGLLLPPVSLGLWQNFGADRPLATPRAILRRAFDLGVTHIDLANNYGPPYGSAETTFGEVLASDLRPYRDELLISTKAGYDMWPGPYGDGGSRKYLVASLDQSLRRTGLDYVDVFYSHRRDPDTPLEETMGALDAVVRAGKALYVGISNYSPEDTARAAELLAELGTPLTLHQPRYSIFDRSPEGGVLDAAAAAGAGVAVFSPLAQGRLTDRYLNGVPEGSRATRSIYLSADDVTEDLTDRARGLNEVAAGRGQTLAQLALRWVLRDPRVTTAIIGASSVAQLEANLQALQGPDLTDDELAAIEPFAAAPGASL